MLLYCSYLNFWNNAHEKAVSSCGWCEACCCCQSSGDIWPWPLPALMPLKHTHTDTHTHAALLPLLQLPDWQSKNYSLRHPSELPVFPPPQRLFVPPPCCWRRCSVMCPSKVFNVVTGLGTTGLQHLRNTAAAQTYGSAGEQPGRSTEAPGVSAVHRGSLLMNRHTHWAAQFWCILIRNRRSIHLFLLGLDLILLCSCFLMPCTCLLCIWS